MTSDGLAVVQLLFSVIWRFFTSWYIPGTEVTPAAALLFFVAAGVGFRFLGRVFSSPDVGGALNLARSASRSSSKGESN